MGLALLLRSGRTIVSTPVLVVLPRCRWAGSANTSFINIVTDICEVSGAAINKVAGGI